MEFKLINGSISKEQIQVLNMLLQGIADISEREAYLEDLGEFYDCLKSDADYFIDERDYNIYSIIKIAGKKWLGENLRYDAGEGCYCYNNEKSYCAEYGRLYTWEAAQKASPKGWHLPSENEWRRMAKIFGGCWQDASDEGKAAYKALIKGGVSGFDARLGGFGRSDGSGGQIGLSGYYWTSTSLTKAGWKDQAWNFNFISYNRLNRVSYGKSCGQSCRYIKD